MGVGLRIPQLCRNPVFQPFRNEVLQPFSLFVYFIPWEVEYVMQKAFQQSVVTQDFQCSMFSRRGQNCAMMLFITHKSRLQPRQPLKHARYRRRSYTQPFSQSIARNPLFSRSAEFQEGFQVIVN